MTNLEKRINTKLLENTRKAFLDFLYPEGQCPLCGFSCEASGICYPCKKGLLTYGPFSVNGVGSYALYHYVRTGEKLIYEAKKNKSFRAIRALKALLMEFIENGERVDFKNFDMVTYIPSSRKMVDERTFDLGYEMAKSIGGKLGIPLIKAITNVGRGQMKKLNYLERKREVEKSLVLNGEESFKIGGRKIILFDDVVTTGSSLDRGVRLLIKAGAKEVFPLVLTKKESFG